MSQARHQLQEVIDECDRKIVVAKKRLDETTDDPLLQDKVNLQTALHLL